MTVVHEALQRAPGVHKRDPRIIDDATVLVPRVLLVAGLKGKGSMDEIAIDIVQLQPPATGVEGRLDPLWTMIAVPQLGGNEQVVPLKRPRLERFLDRIANRFFITVAFRTIEMPKSRFQRRLGGLFGCDGIRN